MGNVVVGVEGVLFVVDEGFELGVKVYWDGIGWIVDVGYVFVDIVCWNVECLVKCYVYMCEVVVYCLFVVEGL